ncbi:MAG TPA: hypothetical protein VGF34_04745 [Stellaceae bacterium]|jgi:hypothetical protein
MLNTGATIDIPYPAELGAWAQGPVLALMWVCATADRPVNDPNRISWPPSPIYDLTLDRLIFLVPNSNPAKWIDITGAPV